MELSAGIRAEFAEHSEQGENKSTNEHTPGLRTMGFSTSKKGAGAASLAFVWRSKGSRGTRTVTARLEAEEF
jgi:hypothetical protein